MMTLYFKKKNSFSILELSIVLLTISIFLSIIFFAKKIFEGAIYSNSLEETTSISNFMFDNNVSLWLETSQISKNYKENQIINDWQDNTNNSVLFESINNVKIINSKFKEGLKSIYFDENSYLKSNFPLNYGKYTIFIVLNSNDNNGNIIKSNFTIYANEIDNNIVIFKNNDNSTLDSFDNLSKCMTIGENWSGEIFEIIIFDKVLDDKKISKIKDYLINKYKL